MAITRSSSFVKSQKSITDFHSIKKRKLIKGKLTSIKKENDDTGDKNYHL